MNDVRHGFCIYIDTVCEGPVPIEHDGNGNIIVHATRESAEREIAGDVIDRLQQFLAGERYFDDAMTVEEYVEEVDVLPDGSIIDESGRQFHKID